MRDGDFHCGKERYIFRLILLPIGASCWRTTQMIVGLSANPPCKNGSSWMKMDIAGWWKTQQMDGLLQKGGGQSASIVSGEKGC
ncbi:MAG: hypothetical protein U0694_06995 [Anaerolineae bacterium]